MESTGTGHQAGEHTRLLAAAMAIPGFVDQMRKLERMRGRGPDKPGAGSRGKQYTGHQHVARRNTALQTNLSDGRELGERQVYTLLQGHGPSLTPSSPSGSLNEDGSSLHCTTRALPFPNQSLPPPALLRTSHRQVPLTPLNS